MSKARMQNKKQKDRTPQRKSQSKSKAKAAAKKGAAKSKPEKEPDDDLAAKSKPEKKPDHDNKTPKKRRLLPESDSDPGSAAREAASLDREEELLQQEDRKIKAAIRENEAKKGRGIKRSLQTEFDQAAEDFEFIIQ